MTRVMETIIFSILCQYISDTEIHTNCKKEVNWFNNGIDNSIIFSQYNLQGIIYAQI